MESKLTWVAGMLLRAQNRGHETMFDVSREQGGSDTAPTPEEVLLNAKSACSGIEAHADKTSTIPSYFSSVPMKYFIKGTDLDREKVIPLVTLNGQLIHQDTAVSSLEVIP